MLRIFSGLYKGRKLKSVKHPDVRPTTAKVKLSFFDIIQDDIRETIFLDGFGGTGNIGIEALSRGADYVVFIEHLSETARVLQQNLDKIGIPTDHYRIIKGDYNRSVIQLARDGFKFDIIFLDPPYELLGYANPLKVIFKRDILREGGIIVLERPSDLRFETKYFECFRTQELGKKSLDFFQHHALSA
jgi:16S rRNA (guanine(966)-N(2))-methyltransferase RsmD